MEQEAKLREALTEEISPADGYEGDALQRPARRPLLQRLIPVSEQVPGYRSQILRRDLLAGVTVAALALPSRWRTPKLPACHR